jgi:dihydrofolate reductase
MFDMFEDLFNRVYLTEVFSGPINGADAFFNYKFDGRKWKTVLEKEIPAGPSDEFASRYLVLDRKFKTVRYVEVEDYLTDDAAEQKWLAKQMSVIENLQDEERETNLHLQYKMFSEEE